MSLIQLDTIETIKEEDSQRDNSREISVTPDPLTNESPETMGKNEDELDNIDCGNLSITESPEIMVKNEDQQEDIGHDMSSF